MTPKHLGNKILVFPTWQCWSMLKPWKLATVNTTFKYGICLIHSTSIIYDSNIFIVFPSPYPLPVGRICVKRFFLVNIQITTMPEHYVITDNGL